MLLVQMQLLALAWNWPPVSQLVPVAFFSVLGRRATERYDRRHWIDARTISNQMDKIQEQKTGAERLLMEWTQLIATANAPVFGVDMELRIATAPVGMLSDVISTVGDLSMLARPEITNWTSIFDYALLPTSGIFCCCTTATPAALRLRYYRRGL